MENKRYVLKKLGVEELFKTCMNSSVKRSMY